MEGDGALPGPRPRVLSSAGGSGSPALNGLGSCTQCSPCLIAFWIHLCEHFSILHETIQVCGLSGSPAEGPLALRRHLPISCVTDPPMSRWCREVEETRTERAQRSSDSCALSAPRGARRPRPRRTVGRGMASMGPGPWREQGRAGSGSSGCHRRPSRAPFPPREGLVFRGPGYCQSSDPPHTVTPSSPDLEPRLLSGP